MFDIFIQIWCHQDSKDTNSDDEENGEGGGNCSEGKREKDRKKQPDKFPLGTLVFCDGPSKHGPYQHHGQKWDCEHHNTPNRVRFPDRTIPSALGDVGMGLFYSVQGESKIGSNVKGHPVVHIRPHINSIEDSIWQ